jgi:uncharacterized protein YceK
MIITRTVLALVIFQLCGCTTISEWRGDFSPVKKECWPNATYFVGSRSELLYAAEFDGQNWRLLDLPFSFAADVVALPISIPGVNRRKSLCDEAAGSFNKPVQPSADAPAD